MGSKHLVTNTFSKNKNRKGKPKVKLYRSKSGGSTKNEDEEINKLKLQYDQVVTKNIKTFKDIPLSYKTQKGLKENNYVFPTEIQRESICIALRGLDILGAAKTGSGKTLAFLIPVLEHLYCKKWTRLDGLGALIITPTRELAFQIFEMLRKVGHFHDFSAGLIIGGKDLHFEKKRMDQCNIVICTPGRLLQHMDENALFSCDNMQILILDEADRCLDLGFEKTMNSIIEHLPPKRQTLLFSATQTKSVRDLARLSLKNPTYVSVHENAAHSTPEALKQSYTVIELHEKMTVLWSFIRSHLKHKIIVFFSSCKQVKYHFEALCRLRPGTSLLALYGSLHQLRRMEIYRTFCGKTHAVLLSTDLAARGLDFPEVDWVVQMDCPEDSATYIHRVGRTARYQKGGEAILVLTPSEETAMLSRLESARIPIENIKINPNKLQSPQRKLEALLARDSNLKESAQRAFVAYLKSVFLMSDKEVFNINAYDTDAYARSLGLAIPPRIRFLQKYQKAIAKQKDETEESSALLTSTLEDSSDYTIKKEDTTGHTIKKKDATGHTIKKEDTTDYTIKKEDCFLKDLTTGGNYSDSDSDEILHIRRKNHELEDDSEYDVTESLSSDHQGINLSKSKKKIITKAAIAKKIIKKKIIANKKTVFDDEGEVLVDGNKQKLTELAKKYEEEVPDICGIDLEQAKKILKEEDKLDKQRERERVKAKHREEKRKLKNAKLKSVDSDPDEPQVKVVLSDEDESSSDGPDLSWLPDPDKVYGEKQDADDNSSNNSELSESESAINYEKNVSNDENSSSSDSENEDSEHEYSNLPMKRKRQSNNKIKKRSKTDQMEDVTLKDDEDLALRFLRNSSH